MHTYKNISTAYSAWIRKGAANDVKTIIFLGAVQFDKLAEWVSENCPPKTIVVQGAPHWLTESDESDIPEYMLDFVKSAFDTLIKNPRFAIKKSSYHRRMASRTGSFGFWANHVRALLQYNAANNRVAARQTTALQSPRVKFNYWAGVPERKDTSALQ